MFRRPSESAIHMTPAIPHYIIWDFEGTLAVRKGRYTGALEAAAAAVDPAFAGTADRIRPFLSGAFPWHGDTLAHPWAGHADGWWSAILSAAQRALVALGMQEAIAVKVAARSRDVYLDLAGWQVDAEAVPVLQALSEQGWRHAILSNFAPELPPLVTGLGLRDHVDHVFTSGGIGLEKPSLALFRHVFDVLAPGRAVWMVGDNPHADIAGGKAAGLSTILLGPDRPDGGHAVLKLSGIPAIILKEDHP